MRRKTLLVDERLLLGREERYIGCLTACLRDFRYYEFEDIETLHATSPRVIRRLLLLVRQSERPDMNQHVTCGI